MDEKSARVLFQANDALKAAQEVNVFGKRKQGAYVLLGKCVVTEVTNGQASCRLEEKEPLNNIVEYRAEINANAGSL